MVHVTWQWMYPAQAAHRRIVAWYSSKPREEEQSSQAARASIYRGLSPDTFTLNANDRRHRRE